MSISRPGQTIRGWGAGLPLMLLTAVGPGCSSSGGGGQPASNGGASGNAGSSMGGAGGRNGAGGGGATNTSGGASGSGGAATNGGASGSGGVSGGSGSTGSGGAAAGSGGTGAGGAAAVDAGDTGNPTPMGDGGGQDSAGGKTCAGNALSLSSNGTGMASDAAQARVIIDLMADLPIGNGQRTVEFWAYIKPTDWIGERNAIYIYGPQSAPASTFGLDFGTNAVTGMAGNHATLNPVTNGGFNDDSRNYLGITSTAAQWVHIAMTWDGTAVKTYVNGALRITSPGTMGITMLATLSSTLSLGCNPNNNNCFNGLFDELRIWKAARTEAELAAWYKKPLVGNEPNLVGYWKFDEAPGAAMAADGVTSAGHTGHPGMLMAASPAQRPTFVAADPPAPIMCP